MIFFVEMFFYRFMMIYSFICFELCFRFQHNQFCGATFVSDISGVALFGFAMILQAFNVALGSATMSSTFWTCLNMIVVVKMRIQPNETHDLLKGRALVGLAFR